MTRSEFAKARGLAHRRYNKECNSLAKRYFKSSVPLKKNIVYESNQKPKRGLTNRFVVFIIVVQHFIEVEMFDVKAGVWWLNIDNKCTKWETLHGVDNVHKTFKRSKNQLFIKPDEKL